MKNRLHIIIFLLALCASGAWGESFEPIKYGDMENWVTRNIKESAIIGGNYKKVYAIAPTRTIDGNVAYTNQGGSPWATSNVMAKVSGVTKASNSIEPGEHPGHGKCAVLLSKLEECKALGIINIKVMVAGSMFLGKMHEPIKSTKSPYSKMEMGIPYTKRPEALVYDYELIIPSTNERVYSSGFGKQKRLAGHDNAEVMILLQRRWEDAEGNIYAKRVGTGRELLTRSSGGWKNCHHLKVNYGDITSQPYYKANMGLIPAAKSYYAKNSKGKMVPVKEVGWDSADATPTHMIVMFSAGSGEPYVGTPGLTFKVDNVGLAFL